MSQRSRITLWLPEAEEGPGSGGLESEVGTSGKQLDRGVRSSRETDLGE